MTRIIGTKCKLGLAHVQREGGPVQPFAEEIPAEERGDAAGAGDDLQDGGQDLVLQHRQHPRRPAGLPGRAAGLWPDPAGASGPSGLAGPPVRSGACLRKWSYSTHRPISCSTTPASKVAGDHRTSIASQAAVRSTSPSSHTPPSPVLTDAAARWAAAGTGTR